MYTSPFIKVTLDQALEIIKAKGYRFECQTVIELNEYPSLERPTKLIVSELGVTRGNGVWHWYKIEETYSNFYDMNKDEDLWSNGLFHTHSYSQNTGQTFKKNQDYRKTATNIFK